MNSSGWCRVKMSYSKNIDTIFLLLKHLGPIIAAEFVACCHAGLEYSLALADFECRFFFMAVHELPSCSVIKETTLARFVNSHNLPKVMQFVCFRHFCVCIEARNIQNKIMTIITVQIFWGITQSIGLPFIKQLKEHT